MELTELYQKGKEILDNKPYGKLLDGVETEFEIPHDRAVLDRYTFRPHCIDGIEARHQTSRLSKSIRGSTSV